MDALRQVAEFGAPRQPIRGRLPRNPLDKCTIVSIYPKKIVEIKHTIEPGYFEIAPGSLAIPSTLVVSSSSWWANRGEQQHSLEIPVFSISIADAIIRDYSNGLLACDMDSRMPGLFFIEGKVGIPEIKEKYNSNLEISEIKQRAWFAELVKIADGLWARSNRNPLCLSDEMRVAAEYLGLKNKAWLGDQNFINDMGDCFACGSAKNKAFAVCPTCRAIDPKHAMAGEIKFAGGV